MNKHLTIFKYEFLHFVRSPFKIIALLLFIVAIMYGCQNGLELYKKQIKEIGLIKNGNKESIDDMILQYDSIENGTQEKLRRDPTIPYWALWNTPSYAYKIPSSMMVFSVGQSEQYGYYKKVTNWSSTFDSDLAEEIANPERLALGTLDFNFVFIYLCPILITVLIFNIGGLEKDLKIDNLLYLQSISKTQWLMTRFFFYFTLIISLIFVLLLYYGILSGAIKNESTNFSNLLINVIAYTSLWFFSFYIINYYGKDSSDHAIKMVSMWLVFCIVIPGFVHQITSIRYPTNYMTDYLDVRREKSNDIFELNTETLKLKLLEEFPELSNTKYATDTTANNSIINRSVSALVNILNKNVAMEIEKTNEEKNLFIKNFSLINPITVFQNKLNSFSSTDYYSYYLYRKKIQSLIDMKINLILNDTWNKVDVNKKRYIEYVEKLN